MPKRLTALGFAFRRFAVPGRVGARVFGLNIGCRYSTPVRKRPLHPTRSQFKPEASQTQAPVTPATEPERRAGGSLTTRPSGPGNGGTRLPAGPDRRTVHCRPHRPTHAHAVSVFPFGQISSPNRRPDATRSRQAVHGRWLHGSVSCENLSSTLGYTRRPVQIDPHFGVVCT